MNLSLLLTNNPARQHKPGRKAAFPGQPSGERGFSIVEMMISITIGLVIVVALVGVLVSNSRTSKTNDRTSELKENGRYALDNIKRELRHAGYRGYTPKAPESGGWVIPAITNECNATGVTSDGSFIKNVRQAVWGAENGNPFPGNCIPSANYNTASNSDVLVIRHADVTPTLAASAAVLGSTLFLHSTYTGESLLQGSAVPATDITGAENAIWHVYVYYIGYDTNDHSVPALHRVTLSGTDMLDEMIVSGIEKLKLEYGIANAAAGTTQYYTASDLGGSTDYSATGVTAWDNVTSVRIWLLARNASAEAGYTNTSVYEMGSLNVANGNAYTVNDSFRRQLFSSVVQLRNFRD